MAVYLYKGIRRDGKSISGTIDAETMGVAKTRLKKQGVYVTTIKDKSRTKKSVSKAANAKKKASVDDLSMMTRQLAVLLKANVPLVDALGAVQEQVENETLSDIIRDAKNFVNEGGSFNKALAKYPKAFNKIYISMVEAGEISGTLDIILIRLAEFTEAQSKLRKKISGAMTYPVLMFVFTGLLLLGLFVFVIPKITGIFDAFPELVLPWYSQAVISTSDFVIAYWVPLLGLSAAMYATFKFWKRTEGGAVSWDAFTLKIPVVGKLARMLAVSRFTRTLSTLLTGGVPMLDAMTIVRNVVNNHILAAAIDDARDNISEGESIAGPLKASGQFPPLVIHMINIGEKTGELENMLTQVSDAYDFQVENQVESLTSLLEPIMLIVMGVIIAVIVFAIMIPIFEISSIGS
ncbi:MAG: type II secretion system protein GspF [Bdellovibrionaceae bacterium]|nr:type II secretion system protein GspF [Pseudobdellovibrionaceae bacterium]|tara:strand:+ start:70955 stop:72172 length:1218 start_codon:yes stop_codon:yes gene_type:complete